MTINSVNADLIRTDDGSTVFEMNPVPPASVLAFPSAEGMGAKSIGGRDNAATVYIVNTLVDNSNPGSFRHACEATGPRFVVFEVSGTISLNTTLLIDDPYITIAGQTSPGGICIEGYPTRVQSDHTIIRYMRFRRGSDGGDPETEGEAVQLSDCHDVIFDHCSITWGTDETFQISNFWGDSYGVTLQWSIIAEGLHLPHPEPDHGYCLFVSDQFYTVHGQELSLHHSMLASCDGRQPWVSGDVLLDYVNNINYNGYNQGWFRCLPGSSSGGGQTDKIPRMNAIGNYHKGGPVGNSTGAQQLASSSVGTGTPPATMVNQLYLTDNHNFGYPGTEEDFKIFDEYGTDEINAGFRRSTPWDMTTEAIEAGVPITITPMSASYAATIASEVGCSYPSRDSADNATISDFTNGTGNVPDDKFYPADYPVLSGTPPADTDQDGIPDGWIYPGWNPPTTSATDNSGNGDYLFIDEYINGAGTNGLGL